MVLLAYSFKLPPPLGTPSYPRGRVVYLVFEDGGVLKHQQNKNLPDSNIIIRKKNPSLRCPSVFAMRML